MNWLKLRDTLVLRSCGRTCLLAVPTIMACSCGITGGGNDNNGRVDDAWALYRQQRFAESADLFLDLATDDVELPESYGGLGWSRLRLLDGPGARMAFQNSLVGDANWIDSRAGEVFALRESGGSADVLLAKARGVLRSDPDWRFTKEPAVDWRDVQVLMAQVFYYSQRFDSCLARCRTVDDAMILSPVDTLSWQGAESYAAALLRELERLSLLVSD